jgi:HEPN domain-containing protein
MSVEKRVRAYLELATKDFEAAELLLAGGNRYSAYHVQQAVEKITKALLLARNIEAGIEHRLEELLKRFPDEDEWPARFETTCFRFASYLLPSGLGCSARPANAEGAAAGAEKETGEMLEGISPVGGWLMVSDYEAVTVKLPLLRRQPLNMSLP